MINMTSLDSGKYWLLELVCEMKFPLRILVHNELEMVVNKTTGHGFNFSELINNLHQLFVEEILIAEIYKTSDDLSVKITPTRNEIENALEGKLKIYYGLTSLGGEQWEKLAKPNWNLYISGSLGQQEISFSGVDRQIIERYLPSLRYTWQAEIVSSSEEWKLLVPWQATYWKILPSGWQLKCKIKETNEYLGKSIPLEDRQWLDKIDNWYTNPFDTTDNSI
jgi:hypothetical protein